MNSYQLERVTCMSFIILQTLPLSIYYNLYYIVLFEPKAIPPVVEAGYVRECPSATQTDMNSSLPHIHTMYYSTTDYST